MNKHTFDSLSQLHNDKIWNTLESQAHHNWTLPDGRKILPVDITKYL